MEEISYVVRKYSFIKLLVITTSLTLILTLIKKDFFNAIITFLIIHNLQID